MHHAPCTMHHAPCTMYHAPCAMHHAPHAPCATCAMRHAQCAMRHAARPMSCAVQWHAPPCTTGALCAMRPPCYTLQASIDGPRVRNLRAGPTAGVENVLAAFNPYRALIHSDAHMPLRPSPLHPTYAPPPHGFRWQKPACIPQQEAMAPRAVPEPGGGAF
eukprot:354348-Chlamydomonas_euryale.AAC.2